MLWLDQLWAVFWPKSVGVSGGAVGWKPSTVSTVDGSDILHQLMVNISHCLQGIHRCQGAWGWDFFHQGYVRLGLYDPPEVVL